MSKQEGELKSAFTAEFTSQLPGFVILLYASAGAPDRSITGGGKTTNWEFKHATPDFESPGIQELTCLKLEGAGYCRYVIWWENALGYGKRTMIVKPRDVFNRQPGLLNPEAMISGFDHKWLVKYIRQVHGV